MQPAAIPTDHGLDALIAILAALIVEDFLNEINEPEDTVATTTSPDQ